MDHDGRGASSLLGALFFLLCETCFSDHDGRSALRRGGVSSHGRSRLYRNLVSRGESEVLKEVDESTVSERFGDRTESQDARIASSGHDLADA